jgi:hypothetical protein
MTRFRMYAMWLVAGFGLGRVVVAESPSPTGTAEYRVQAEADSPATGPTSLENLDGRIQAIETELQASPDDPARRLALAKLLYFKGLDGDSKASARAESILLKLAEKTKDDPMITAYLGSSRLIAAARTWALAKKGSMCKEGLALLDRAVNDAPEDEEIRFLRAASTFHLPGFFKRAEQSAADFAWIAPRAKKAVESGKLDRTIAAAALFHDGVCRNRKSDKAGARVSWEAAVEIGPETRAGRDAAMKLKSIRGS